MKTSNPAIRKANSYLQDMLSKGTWKPGDRLPSIRLLAQSAGISPVPMWRAVNMLASDGVLEVIQGSGIRVKPYPEEANAVIRKGWLGLRDRIHKDIICGFYPPGTLMPTLKEMRVHYGVSFRTLKKALDNLAGGGSIAQEYRTYRVVSYSSHKATGKIVLLGWSHSKVEMQSRTPWGEEFLRNCENLCSSMRLNLSWMSYTNEEGFLSFTDQNGQEHKKLLRDDSVMGYLLWAQSPDELYHQVLSQLVTFNKPVAILLEGTQLNLSDMMRRYKKLKVFSIATGSRAAQTVASFLLQNGHRQIVYLSPFHKSDWSKARLHGLQEIYNRAGEECRVHPFTINHYGPSHEFEEATRLPDIFSDTLISSLSQTRKFSKQMHASMEELKKRMRKACGLETISLFMQPLLRKAIEIDDCTAWVCASDNAALISMVFLEDMDKRISVVGFDDTFEAFRRGLTSYNFNIRGLVQSMLIYIINPNSESMTKTTGTFEIDGMLVKRRTTFRV